MCLDDQRLTKSRLVQGSGPECLGPSSQMKIKDPRSKSIMNQTISTMSAAFKSKRQSEIGNARDNRLEDYCQSSHNMINHYHSVANKKPSPFASHSKQIGDDAVTHEAILVGIHGQRSKLKTSQIP